MYWLYAASVQTDKKSHPLNAVLSFVDPRFPIKVIKSGLKIWIKTINSVELYGGTSLMLTCCVEDTNYLIDKDAH